MRNIFKLVMFAVCLAIAFVAMPKQTVAIDTDDQVTYCVDQVADLPVMPVNSICLENPPDIVYMCGVAVDGEETKSVLKQAISIWQKYGGEIAALLLALLSISEALSGSTKIEANGIVQLIKNFLKKRAKPIT